MSESGSARETPERPKKVTPKSKVEFLNTIYPYFYLCIYPFISIHQSIHLTFIYPSIRLSTGVNQCLHLTDQGRAIMLNGVQCWDLLTQTCPVPCHRFIQTAENEANKKASKPPFFIYRVSHETWQFMKSFKCLLPYAVF